MAKVAKRRSRSSKPLQTQIDDLQKQLDGLKAKVHKKKGSAASSPPKMNLLANIDPAKLGEWLALLSNPAIQEIIGQWRTKISAEEPRRRGRRRLLF